MSSKAFQTDICNKRRGLAFRRVDKVVDTRVCSAEILQLAYQNLWLSAFSTLHDIATMAIPWKVHIVICVNLRVLALVQIRFRLRTPLFITPPFAAPWGVHHEENLTYSRAAPSKRKKNTFSLLEGGLQ